MDIQLDLSFKNLFIFFENLNNLCYGLGTLNLCEELFYEL